MRFDARLIKEQVSLREIFAADGHELKKAGPNYWKCRCPFHQEDTASCVVHDRPENYFKCFGCDEGGSVFDYWMKTRGCDFNTAITALSTGTPANSGIASTRPVSEPLVSPAPGPDDDLAPRMDDEVEVSWLDSVTRLKEHPQRVKQMAEWRGYSPATIEWVNELGLLGMLPYMGLWREAFLVERPDAASGNANGNPRINNGSEVSGESRVLGERSPAANDEGQEKQALSQARGGDDSPSLIPVGYHVRLGPKTTGNPGNKASWRYVPTGIGNWPFVLGNVETAKVLFFVEGQWDALALVDCMGWHGFRDARGRQIGVSFPKQVAIVAMRGATSWKRFVQYYWWDEDAVAFVLGDADTAGAEWLKEDGFIFTLRLRCKRVWCFYPQRGKDFNDLWKARAITREQLVIWLRDKMRHRIKGRRNAGVTFLQFCRSQKKREDAIGECARIIVGDKKHRPAGRKPLKVWERYFHKYVPEEKRSSMYAMWREWVRSRTGGIQKEAA